MHVNCPYCKHRHRIENAVPGRFKPTCTRCDKRFLLVVPGDPDSSPMATPLATQPRSRKRLPPPSSKD